MIGLSFVSLVSRRVMAALAAAAVLGSAPVFAHDLWIEPTTFTPVAGEIVGLRLRIGENLQGESMPLNASLVNEFVVVDGSGRKPVYGRDGGDPAGLLRVASPGLLVFGYRSNPSFVDMIAEKFNGYLMEEGLDSIAALRASRKQTEAGARDRYFRCAKSLVCSGTPSAAQTDRQLGFPLEIVAERNPYALKAGGELPVRLTFGGRPLPGALVVAVNRLNPVDKQMARTDSQGRVKFTLQHDGTWLIKCVHMVEAAAGAGADWDSYWASLTFERKARR